MKPVRNHVILARLAALCACMLIVASAVALPGCRRAGSNDVVIGVIAARTGDRALWGEDLYRGIELAVEQANGRGGLLGRHVRLLALDDASHDEQAGTLTGRLCEHE